MPRPRLPVALRVASTWLAAMALGLAAIGAHAATIEYSVKAAYLTKFAPFVEWPASVFADPSSPFNLCVVGDDPFGSALDQAVSGHHVGEHPVVVRRLKRVSPGSGCRILYIGGSSAQSVSDAIKSVQGEPVLTVADHSPASAGAVIQFVVADNRVRFDIDTAAAAANRVSISSKLLSLAVPHRTGAS